jgi:hypothetical protein
MLLVADQGVLAVRAKPPVGSWLASGAGSDSGYHASFVERASR